MNKAVFIIAEAGVNHNGDAKTALKMIDVAKACGADAIKFQAFIPSSLVSRFAVKAEYQKKQTGRSETQLQMLEKLSLDFNVHRQLYGYCKKSKIIYLASPFDLQSIDFLITLKLPFMKIPSGEITNLPYLRKIARLNRKVLLSTGMSDVHEIKKSLDVFTAYGTKKSNITLLHCTTEYPALVQEVNLRAMETLRNKFKVDVGYSDHTQGIEISLAAVARGATVIEKHFTLDKKMHGPDHSASLEPSEFKLLVSSIRNIEMALGNGVKLPSPSELKNREIVRKSIVALSDIKKGEIFSEKNITAKRPGSGISPMNWMKVIGKKAKRDFRTDEMVTL